MTPEQMRADPHYHEGPVQVRFHKDGGGVVLCPFGHYVTSWRRGEWAGSWLEAKIGAHQAGTRLWVEECIGTIPTIPQGARG